MSTATKYAPAEKSQKSIIAEVKKTAERMKQSKLTSIPLASCEEFELDDSMLDRFAGGCDFDEDYWYLLGGFLIATAKPKVFQHSACSGRDCGGQLEIGYIQMFEGLGTEVITCCVPKITSIHHEVKGDAGWLVGCDPWKFSVNILEVRFNIRTSHNNQWLRSYFFRRLDGGDHEPYQDAILFDMLLDLAIVNFKPYAHKIEEGPTIMLGILEALEKVQKEEEAADDPGATGWKESEEVLNVHLLHILVMWKRWWRGEKLRPWDDADDGLVLSAVIVEQQRLVIVSGLW
ncbi:hypothetical protein K458DRAFT_391194 [Lentithecium fluviatile CBS 122367]|uniref:Uncharacterized protein n=1 Tax=Lentithecium fluviatile CBS 122367 TaxID=1168545 RepID=A0A6G1IW25_9PLEO|nr:hypothetical protein K458DRAFT_391194 [Lentithecium fluviatile CBS 122367]